MSSNELYVPGAPRPKGIEQEYNVWRQTGNDLRLSAARMILSLPDGIETQNGFLSNAARFYLDVGEHPEYATPECESVDELVPAHFAGDRIMDHVFTALNDSARFPYNNGRKMGAHKSNYIRGKVSHDNPSGASQTCGTHENYLTTNDVWELRDNRLPTFLSVKAVLFGSGGLIKEKGKRAHLTLCQKYFDVGEVYGSSRTNKLKPLILNRREPLADEGKWGRVQIPSAGRNMVPSVLGLRVAITDLVLSLLETDKYPDRLVARDPIEALHLTCEDPSLKTKIDLANGGSLTSLDILRGILEAGLSYCETEGAPDDIHTRAKQALAILEKLTQDPDSVMQDLEWPVKLHMLRSAVSKRGTPLSNEKIAMLDMNWHDISANGTANILLAKKWWPGQPSNEDIDYYILNPSSDLRAIQRGLAIKHRSAIGLEVANWNALKMSHPKEETEAGKDSEVEFHAINPNNVFRMHGVLVDQLSKSLLEKVSILEELFGQAEAA